MKQNRELNLERQANIRTTPKMVEGNKKVVNYKKIESSNKVGDNKKKVAGNKNIRAKPKTV